MFSDSYPSAWVRSSETDSQVGAILTAGIFESSYFCLVPVSRSWWTTISMMTLGSTPFYFVTTRSDLVPGTADVSLTMLAPASAMFTLMGFLQSMHRSLPRPMDAICFSLPL